MSNDDIQARVEAFTADLTALIRRAALDAVKQVLDGDGARAPSPSQKRGRPAGSGVKPSSAARPHVRKPGEKRDPKILEALVERLFTFIKANPGQRIEPIGEALGLPTKDLALPVKKLLRAKRIAAKGLKRATTYSVAGSASDRGAVAKPKTKAAKRVAKTPAKKAAKKVAKPRANKAPKKPAKKVVKAAAKKVAASAVEVKPEASANP
jgi:hypothetical protein